MESEVDKVNSCMYLVGMKISEEVFNEICSTASDGLQLR